MKLIQGDCLEEMKKMPDKSIDMILCDLPYKETGNKWDNKLINTRALFYEYERLLKENGAIALTATMKFAHELIRVGQHLYKYDWIWEKDNGTNAPNINLQPFRVHEFVLIFGKGRVTNGSRIPMKYNPQKTAGKPYKQMSGKVSENWKGGLKNVVTDNPTGLRHPKTIQYFKRDRGLHPTQKPVTLFEFLIKTYTNEKDMVLDNCMGSGTAGVACNNTNRDFIGIEINKEYYDIAVNRINQTIKSLF